MVKAPGTRKIVFVDGLTLTCLRKVNVCVFGIRVNNLLDLCSIFTKFSCIIHMNMFKSENVKLLY